VLFQRARKGKPERRRSSRGLWPRSGLKHNSKAGGSAGLANESRRSAAARQTGLAGKRKGGTDLGNLVCVVGPEESPEERSPRAWGCERQSRGQRWLNPSRGSPNPEGGTSEKHGKAFQTRRKFSAKKRASPLGHAEGPKTESRSLAPRAESAKRSARGNAIRGKPLWWRARTREDTPGVCRQNPGGSGFENPKGRVKPRPKGESASHKRSRSPGGNSEARANHGSGRKRPVTAVLLPE
jgi:hypothetical protein